MIVRSSTCMPRWRCCVVAARSLWFLLRDARACCAATPYALVVLAAAVVLTIAERLSGTGAVPHWRPLGLAPTTQASLHLHTACSAPQGAALHQACTVAACLGGVS